MTKTQNNFVFFGSSDFSIPVLEKLKNLGIFPVLAITAPEKNPVKTWSEKNSVVVFQPKKLDDATVKKIQTANCRFFVLASYGKIIPEKIINIPEKGILNVHPSLLPRHRGPSPIQTTILEGDKKTGVSVILMDKKIDHGPILAQKKLNHELRIMNYEKLEQELAELGGELLVEIIPKWLSGEISPVEQEHDKATFTKKIKKDDGRIDWQDTAEHIERMVRAYNPWPSAYTFWERNGKKNMIKILNAGISEEKKGRPGLVSSHPEGIAVSTSKGILIIKDVQLEGKNPMSAKAFLNGHPNIIGNTLL